MLGAGLCALAATGSGVWPPPRSITVDGPHARISPALDIHIAPSAAADSLLLSQTVRRSAQMLRAGATGEAGAAIKTVRVLLSAADVASAEALDQDTDYSYELRTSTTDVVVSGRSVFGVQYALESLAQLAHNGSVATRVVVRDSPDYGWRGLMVDAGRRFFPTDRSTMAGSRNRLCRHTV